MEVIRLSNFVRLGQWQYEEEKYFRLSSLYRGHTNKKWYSFSITLRLQFLHFRSLRGIFSCRPFSIARLCADTRNLLNAILFLFTNKI